MFLDDILKVPLCNTDFLEPFKCHDSGSKFTTYFKYDCVCIYILPAYLHICNQRPLSRLSVWNGYSPWTTDIVKILELFTKNMMLVFCLMCNQWQISNWC